MFKSPLLRVGFLVSVSLSILVVTASAQSLSEDEEFGPVVRAYLGYLKNEQNVVDDRASRHEVDAVYYRRNSNRIRALRQMAMRIARESHNDYLPELEAVANDEFGLLFEQRPRFGNLRVGDVFGSTFRYLGTVRTGEMFHVFARLDPYEQADFMAKGTANGDKVSNPAATSPISGIKVSTRSRRVSDPH